VLSASNCCIILESVAGKTDTSLVPSLKYTSSDNEGIPTPTCFLLTGEAWESACGLHWLTYESVLSPPGVLVHIIDHERDIPSTANKVAWHLFRP